MRGLGKSALVLFMAVCATVLTTTLPAFSAPDEKITPKNRLAIMREIAHEYVVLQKPLPASTKEKEALQVDRTGKVNEEGLRKLLVLRGVALETGQVVQISKLEFKDDYIQFEINGGGKKKKKWWQRIRISGSGPVGGGTVPLDRGDDDSVPPGVKWVPGSGSWVRLEFSQDIPDMTPTELKEILAGVFEFGTQRSPTVPWIETLPEEFQEAIKQKKAVVGMNREMVIAALGRPQRKVREVKSDGQEYEDWIYGNPPFVTFVTFLDDEVVEVREYE